MRSVVPDSKPALRGWCDGRAGFATRIEGLVCAGCVAGSCRFGAFRGRWLGRGG